MKVRLYEFDFIRAISALSVIAIHTTSAYILTNDIGYVWNQLIRYAVPMFIIISGFLLYNSDRNKEMGYLSFLAKRLNKILIPYFLWSAIYALYNFRGSIIHDHSLGEIVPYYLKHLLTGIDHLYFMVIIFQLYLLYPLLKWSFKKGHDKLVLLLAFLMTFYFQLASYVSNWGYLILPKKLLVYNYISFPCWIFYFALGMYLVTHMDKWKDKVTNIKLNISLAWFICSALLIAESKITGTFESSMKPIIIVYSIITFFLFYLVSKYIATKTFIQKIFTWISEQSFIIYLSHILIMRLVRAAAYRIGFTNIWDSLSGMTLFFIVTVLSTLVFTYLLSFIPFISWLGGVSIKKQTVFNKSQELSL
ncbi:acyltransferase [Pseudobacteroides cellulosolvens]|uniref:Acyltransferase 3 n=1 Tax=Pseudobacteroides cellulosolvens ATCC 35603 = DSM 2933 TaxID=398512 RepID=A0A0L6JWP8_9FIRM|nr:acyltransferase [Pseudobacteroides cellulosolvens]KNY30035.1 acyltransferase 3 [Pseudobacteroides cellulosolvens ATCC 35603 = DSM 2933]